MKNMNRVFYLNIFFSLSFVLTSCIVRPQFKRVYTSPEYRVLVLNENYNPVSHTRVVFKFHDKSKGSITSMTDGNGVICFPARYKSKLNLDVFVKPTSLGQNEIDLCVKVENDSFYVKHYFYAVGLQKRIVSDTIVLNSLRIK